MKVEESFKDLKSHLNMDKLMNKKQKNMEKMLAMVLLAYYIGFVIGEEMRRQIYKGKKTQAIFRLVCSPEAEYLSLIHI